MKNNKKVLISLIGLVVIVIGICVVFTLDNKSEGDSGKGVSRNMSSREAFMLQISVASDYFTEGKRPKKPLTEKDKEGQLWCNISDGQENWIYPDREMTEEEILQILDYKYSDIDKSFYTPKEGQLTADDAEARTKELLQEYVPGLGKIDEIYVIYFANDPTPDGLKDCWSAYIHMKNSDHDYYARFTADTGKLVELVQGEKDCFTGEYYLEARLNGKAEVIAE